jgi:hypothetical protein
MKTAIIKSAVTAKSLALCAALIPLLAGASCTTRSAASAAPANSLPRVATSPAPASEESAPKDFIAITGKVRIVGNAPFTEMVITDDAGTDWFVPPAFRPALENRQNQAVTVRAAVKVIEQRLADGKLMPPRHELTDMIIADPAKVPDPS